MPTKINDIHDASVWNEKDVASVAICYGRDVQSWKTLPKRAQKYQCPHCRAVSLIKQFGYAATRKYVEDRQRISDMFPDASDKEGSWFNRLYKCVMEHERWREGHQGGQQDED